jgi:hypothetical protein
MATTWQIEGQCKVSFRDGSHVSLKFSEFTRARDEWMSGRAFGSFLGIHDYLIVVKFAEVNCILECTADSIAREAADDKEYVRQQSYEG